MGNEKADKIESFIWETFQKAGFTNAVIGVSGGVDSAVSCALSVRALGKENVYPVLMPYGMASMEGTLDGMNFVQGLGILIGNMTRFDIKPAVDSFEKALGPLDNARRGNMIARARMIVLFDQAKKRKALVVGTENKSEHLLGYFTRFGDEASDVEPLRNFYKSDVYELAQFLEIPENILKKAPTAGLWAGQTDEGEFGFSYQDADKILALYYDQKKSIEDIIKTGISRETVEKVARRVEENTFKHNLPYVLSS